MENESTLIKKYITGSSSKGRSANSNNFISSVNKGEVIR